MIHDMARGGTATQAFDAIVAKKTEDGLKRVARWNAYDIEDDLQENPVLRVVHEEIEQRAAQEIVRQITESSTRRPGSVQLRPLGDIETEPEAMYRVRDVMPAEGNVLIVAQRKSGKTVLALNLAHAILEGTDFLGTHPVAPVTGSVAFLNYELSPHMFQAWSRDLGLSGDRFLVANVRGHRNPLGNTADRRELAQAMQGHAVEVLFIDPFSVAYTGQDANSPSEVRAWLTQIEHWFRDEAAGREIVLTAHAGWSSENRARGASSLEDWPDSIINLVTQGQAGHRTFSVRGRDVAVDPVAIEMDPETRVLRTSRRGPQEPLQDACLLVIQQAEGINTEQVGVALRERGIRFRKGEENRALRALIDSGQIKVREGQKGARLHYLA